MSCFKRCCGLCSALGMLLTTLVDKGVLLLRVQRRCVIIIHIIFGRLRLLDQAVGHGMGKVQLYLSGCTFSQCTLFGCNLSRCNFSGCTLSGFTLSQCTLSGCTLSGCTLAKMHNVCVHFVQVHVARVSFIHCLGAPFSLGSKTCSQKNYSQVTEVITLSYNIWQPLFAILEG